MASIIRPNAEPAATVVQGGDIFLIDGATGVRALAASSVLVKDANGNFAVTNIVQAFATTATAAATTTLTVASAAQQFFTGTTTQTVVLPVVSTLLLGHTFSFQNNSTGLVTVQSSGGNTVAVLAAGEFARVTCIAITGTSAASWQLTPMAVLNTAQTFTALQSLIGNDNAGSGYRFYRANAATYTELFESSGGLGGTNDALNFYSNTIAAIAASLGRDGTFVTANGLIALGTAGVGYGTGAGGSVTQATSKATGVTLSKTCGQITMNAAALAAGTIVSFVTTNTLIAATDTLVLNHISGGTPGSYSLNGRCAAGSATIDVRNNTAGSLSEAIVIQYALVKSTIT